jgi:hypothetical protein
MRWLSISYKFILPSGNITTRDDAMPYLSANTVMCTTKSVQKKKSQNSVTANVETL